MNLLHMKYAVEVAETNSINKAAEVLYVGQSALSRAIKELETGLGIAIFERSAKGMFLTPDGEIFIRYAKTILKQVDDVEKMFREGASGKKRFSISVPRASYISDAFAKFSRLIDQKTDAQIFYKETNSMRAIKNILSEDYKLGIVRYAENFDRYYKSLLDEKALDYELIAEFRYVLLVNASSPLAGLEKITYDDLKDYMEIAHADPYVPSLPFEEVKKEELPGSTGRQIFVFERGSQFELLNQNPETFMWVSPVPSSILERYNLVQRICKDNKRVYKDVLIHRKDYALSELDKQFVELLVRSKREILGQNII
ncbi:MAG: LysR family transcriptional regulator [Firmicutes bacterium]|nr:LysR family transcriptional regulator [Bacillota bacterium]